MYLYVNGEKLEFEEGFTINKLLKQFEIDACKVAIEKNMEIALYSEYDQSLMDNDKIEIVYFIGGG